MHIEWDFPDAPFTSAPFAGIDQVYDPPYYEFWSKDSLATIRGSCSWLFSYTERNGPYDAVMSFSQGGTLVASALLLHEAETSRLPQPFKAAIFFGGGPPLTVMDSLGFDIAEDSWQRDRASRTSLAGSNDSSHESRKGRWVCPSLQEGEITEEELRDEIAGPYCIPIPTAHFYGSNDPRLECAVELSGICESTKRRTYTYHGRHEIPRSCLFNKTAAEMVRQLLKETRTTSMVNGAY
ncbi:hypothetical protein ATETN484_0003022600 [Aspergillus terreus]|nr:hypothetical protein ATETN484_0003022600 [Aspergillus terreus]